MLVGVGPEGYTKIPAALERYGLAWGTDGNAFSQMALKYYKDPKVGIIDKFLTCQLSYVIVIGDGAWMHRSNTEGRIETLRKTHKVKTLVVAYGGGISGGSMTNFNRMARIGSCDDTTGKNKACEETIIANTPGQLKTKLQIEINDLISNNKEINTEILQERDYSKTLEEKIASLKDKSILAQKENNQSLAEIVKLRAQISSLKIALSQVNLKLSQLQALFEKLKSEDEKNKIETANLGKELNSALASRVKELQKFRSEFFGRLSELLEDREEIRVVGDRFVFQSELLFEKGSANLGQEGNEQLKQLFITLDDIAKTIPNDINWVLQVEGHTDNIPIRAGKYRDNWHLSTERALSVVRFLIDKGIEAKRLSATGYGEFQPLSKLDNTLSLEEKNSKNRRIELKITQRIID